MFYIFFWSISGGGELWSGIKRSLWWATGECGSLCWVWDCENGVKIPYDVCWREYTWDLIVGYTNSTRVYTLASREELMRCGFLMQNGGQARTLLPQLMSKSTPVSSWCIFGHDKHHMIIWQLLPRRVIITLYYSYPPKRHFSASLAAVICLHFSKSWLLTSAHLPNHFAVPYMTQYGTSSLLDVILMSRSWSFCLWQKLQFVATRGKVWSLIIRPIPTCSHRA